MRKKIMEQKGITLVALIITIIILLILAVVAIGAVHGGGIIEYATNAKEDYAEAQKNEKYALSQLEDYLTEHQTGVRVEQVTDIAPGVLEGEGTESVPYVINSIEDLVFFAYDVTNGNSYSGKTVSLGLNLDFNSTKSYIEAYRTDYEKYGYNGELKTLLTTGEGFIPIGRFEGSFNGNGNQINNLYINKTNSEDDAVGFFRNNKGTISNLTLSNVKLYVKSEIGTALGGICGQNSATGYIENCIVSGNIVNESQGPIGGITCYCSGKIEKSINLASVIRKKY